MPITIVVLFNCIVNGASATDLNSSQTGYVLDPAGNPYNVASQATIDTTAQSTIAIYGSPNRAFAWSLTNNGTVIGGYFAIEFDSPAVIANNGSIISHATSAIALYSGGSVNNAAGASIIGRFDGIYSNGSTSSVTNAGDIGGSAEDLAKIQSSVHLPSGGTVTNLATGRIAAYGPAILSNSATTVVNDGLIISVNGTAIDLSAGANGVGSVVSNSGRITGNGGTAILFGAGDDTLMLAGTSAITGVVDAGGHSASGTNTLILGGATAGSFDISNLGATAQYRGFDTLLKNDSGTWTMTGANVVDQTWRVSGGAIVMQGALSGSVIAAPGATGIDIGVSPGGSIQASSGSAISINDASRVSNSGSIISNADDVATLAVKGAGTSVVNVGLIAAQGARGIGVAIDAPTGTASLTNAQGGSIKSAAGVAVLAGSNVSIANAGTLSGSNAAVRFTGSNNRLLLDSGSVVSGDIDGGSGPASALILQGSGALSSHTYGMSTLTMEGTYWTISSPVEITSSSTIRSGALSLTGSLTSPTITFAPDTMLSGTGSLHGAVTLQGVIAPGVTNAANAPVVSGLRPLAVGTLSVTGSYTQTAGSRYEADVTPQGNDLISIDGTASLHGGVVQAHLRAASFTPSDTYTIVSTTAGLAGVFSGIETFNPFVSASLVYDANNAYIHVQRGFRLAGGTPNEIAVETGLDHGLAGIAGIAGGAATGSVPTRDFLSVAGDLLSLEGTSAYGALDQLSAEAYAAFPNAHFEAARLGMDAIDARLTAARTTGECATSPANDADPGARACSWISLLGSTSKIGGYDTLLGQQIGLAGVMSGVDYRIVPKVMIGAALAAIRGNTSTDTLPVHGQFDSYQAALYGGYAPGSYWAQATVGYARNIDQMKRSLFFTDTPRTALGNVDGNQYFASLRNGIDVPVGKLGVVAPFVALEMQRVESPAFNETGADSVNLAVSSNTANAMRSLLGAQWRNRFDWLGRAWSLNGELAWVHRYGTQTQAISASFEGAPNSGFTVHGSGPARDAAQAGLGVQVALGQKTHAFLRYDGEFGGGGHTHAGSAGFDYLW